MGSSLYAFLNVISRLEVCGTDTKGHTPMKEQGSISTKIFYFIFREKKKIIIKK